MSPAKGWKEQLVEGATRVVQSDEFKRVSAWAKQTSRRIRTNWQEAKKAFQEQMNDQSDDDLAELKRTLDRMEKADRRTTGGTSKTDER